jgi:hypothetical protein
MDADKPKTVSFIDAIGADRAHELMVRAVREAVAAADAAGLPQAVVGPDGRVYRVYPDGRREPIGDESGGSDAGAVGGTEDGAEDGAGHGAGDGGGESR